MMGMSPMSPLTSPGRTAATILAGGAATAASASPARPALADTVGPAIRGRLAPTQFPRVSKGWRGGALARGTHQKWCAACGCARGRAPEGKPRPAPHLQPHDLIGPPMCTMHPTRFVTRSCTLVPAPRSASARNKRCAAVQYGVRCMAVTAHADRPVLGPRVRTRQTAN
jgi:hypothetical protein